VVDIRFTLHFCTTLTAIFAKVGIRGVDTDLAMAIRTAVDLVLAWALRSLEVALTP
jgi:uncharacterized membrane protein